MTWANTAGNNRLLQEIQKILKSIQENQAKHDEILRGLVDRSSGRDLSSSLQSSPRETAPAESGRADGSRSEQAALLKDIRKLLDDLRDCVRSRDPATLKRVLDDFLGEDDTSAKTIQEIRDALKKDEPRYNELKGKRQLQPGENNELETLELKRRLAIRLIELKTESEQPTGEFTGNRSLRDHQLTPLPAPEEREDRRAQVLMMPLSARVSEVNLRSNASGARGSEVTSGFELVMEDRASQERSGAQDANDYQNLLVRYYPRECTCTLLLA